MRTSGTHAKMFGMPNIGTIERRTAGTPRPEKLLWRLLGPAFVAAIAYVDPGNVAANLTAGASYGYLLLWVLIVANAMAVLIQYLSASLGLVTGRSLPELLGERLSRWPRLAYWAQAEVVAAATDVAEVVGGAIALHLLFGIPLVWGGLITGVISMALLGVHARKGQQPFELIIIAFLAVIAVGFVAGLFFADVSVTDAMAGVVPRFGGSGTVLVAASMLGATVMPHAIYLHSSLARDRHLPAVLPDGSLAPRDAAASTEHRAALPRLLRATRADVLLSLAIAGSVNIAMLVLAASALRGVGGTETIEGAHAAIVDALGSGVGVVFAIGLLASGLAASSVGAYAGAVIMGGLLKRRLPLLLRRVLTLVPALIVLAIGLDPTRALVMSQVVLSVGIPFALVPLVRLTADHRVMGDYATGRLLRGLAWLAAALIIALNVALLVITLRPH